MLTCSHRSSCFSHLWLHWRHHVKTWFPHQDLDSYHSKKALECFSRCSLFVKCCSTVTWNKANPLHVYRIHAKSGHTSAISLEPGALKGPVKKERMNRHRLNVMSWWNDCSPDPTKNFLNEKNAWENPGSNVNQERNFCAYLAPQ